MNSIEHFCISVLKSLIRIFSCVFSIKKDKVGYIAIGFLIAEIFGIAEEVFDKR